MRGDEKREDEIAMGDLRCHGMGMRPTMEPTSWRSLEIGVYRDISTVQSCPKGNHSLKHCHCAV